MATFGCAPSWARSPPGQGSRQRRATSTRNSTASHGGAVGNKAAIAVAHSILTAVYHVLSTGQPYADLGVDYFDRLNSSRIEHHHVRRLKQLGYSVTLKPMTA